MKALYSISYHLWNIHLRYICSFIFTTSINIAVHYLMFNINSLYMLVSNCIMAINKNQRRLCQCADCFNIHIVNNWTFAIALNALIELNWIWNNKIRHGYLHNVKLHRNKSYMIFNLTCNLMFLLAIDTNPRFNFSEF